MNAGRRRFSGTAPLLLGLLTVPATSATTERLPVRPYTTAAGLAECDAQARAEPRILASYECYAVYAEAGGDPALAEARLESALAVDPQNHWARLGLARLLQFRDRARTVDLARAAIEGFVEQGNRVGEAEGRLRLFSQYTITMRLAEAEAEAERALEAAEAAGDRRLLLTIRILQSRIALNRNDATKAWIGLRGVELDPHFEGLPPRTQALCLQLLHVVANMLDLNLTSNRYSERYAEVVAQHDLRDKRATAHTQLAVTAQNAFSRGELTRERALAVIREALRVALEAGDRIQETEVRLILSRVADMDEAEAQWKAIRGRAGKSPAAGFPAALAAREQARRLMALDPPRAGEALPYLEQAIAGTSGIGLSFYAAEVVPLLVEAHLLHDPEHGLDTALAALRLIEYHRELQSGEEFGARLFARYTGAYYRIIDFLLDERRGASPDDLARAFGVSERMRARTLFAHLRRVREPVEDSPTAQRRRAVLEQIATLQLSAIRSATPPEERALAQRDVERLELEEQGLRAELMATDAAQRVPRGSELPELAAVQSALAGDEALLVFLVPPGNQRSWVIAVRADGVRAFALPGGDAIESELAFWLGALQRRDGTGDAGAVRLYRDLLADAVSWLPASVCRLVVLPDGPLHRLPFDALRPAPGDAPLAERFETSWVPSASVWLLVREARRAPSAPSRALVLADPEPPDATTRPAASRAALPAIAAGRLPHARREGRDALRALGGNGELRTGKAASESFLRHADLAAFSLVHIAAHAIVDADDPGRSAILLSPGESADDGLLQAREIADLDLGGSLVTLSACRSASGIELRGEGVLGLARSLFQARARAVIGGLWPLDDRETARLMGAFYRHLNEGHTAAHALASAKREMLRGGEPAAAWAGVVLLGSEELRPWLPGSSPSPSRNRRRALLGGLAALVLVGALWRLRRRG